MERSGLTRTTLLDAARALFVEKGFAATSTPEVAAAAGMSRGALYHQFEDKAALLDAVLEREASTIARDIEAAAPARNEVEALLAGARAYMASMAEPGRARLLLVEGPAALGLPAMRRLDKATGGRTLAAGLRAALPERSEAEIEAFAELLSAAFDRASLVARNDEERAAYGDALETLLRGLLKEA